MIRKVVFPLKFKLITVMTVLVVGALAFYVFYAVDLFQKDKSAYVFETNLSSAEGLSEQVSSYLDKQRDSLVLVGKTFRLMNGKKLAAEIFQLEKEFIHVGSYRRGNDSWEKEIALVREQTLTDNGIPQDYFDQYIANRKNEFDKIELGRVLFKRVSIQEDLGLLMMGIKVDQKHVMIGHFDGKGLSGTTRKGGIFERFLVDTNGFIFSHSDSEKLGQQNNYLSEILVKGSGNGVREVRTGDKKILVAFDKILPFGLLAISVIPVEVAFQVSDFLVQKSIYFGLFIISIAIIIGVLFSRTLTRPIEVLASGTKELAKGNFQTDLTVSGKDEIGALSDSFNFMSKQIVRFLEEMKEKARIENELEVAQLVQSTFFPPTDKGYGDLFISSYYLPASECGGDWWGFHRQGNRLMLVMADATGHGVPAALLTATAHCAFHTLIEFSESQPQVIESADTILHFMNRAVCNVGQKIMMTCFVAIVDLDTMKINYSNSSHNPPLLYKHRPGEISKGDFSPLMESNGPRLGHQADANYTSTTVDIVDGDILVVFTDGLIEMKNPEEKEWGQRRLLKSLMGALVKHPTDARDSILQDVHHFAEEVEADDDVSLMLVSIGKLKEQRKAVCSLSFPDEYSGLFIKVKDLLAQENIPVDLGITEGAHTKNITFCDKQNYQTLSELDPKTTIFLSDFQDEEMISNILIEHKFQHVVGMNGINAVGEIASILKGINSGGVLPFEVIFPEEKIKSTTLQSSKSISEKLEQVLIGVDVNEYFSSPVDYLRHIGNELLTNAFYNAPILDDGSNPFSEQSRKVEVTLEDDKAISLAVAIDKEKVGIKVIDPFGSLTAEKFLEKLVRGHMEKAPEEKEGGAGLGIYLVFNYANQIIINIEKGKSTEFIAIIENNRRFKKYKERKTSLHVFETLT